MFSAHTCTCSHAHAHTCTCSHTHAHTRTCSHMHMLTHTCSHTQCSHTHTHAHTHTHSPCNALTPTHSPCTCSHQHTLTLHMLTPTHTHPAHAHTHTHAQVDEKQFIAAYEAPGLPVVITHSQLDWQANKKWTTEVRVESQMRDNQNKSSIIRIDTSKLNAPIVVKTHLASKDRTTCPWTQLLLPMCFLIFISGIVL